VAAGLLFWPGIPEETDKETRVLAVTPHHASEQLTASLREKQLRRITFNGKPLTSQQQRCLESLELSLGLRLPDRDYWCDSLELWSGLKSVGLIRSGHNPFSCQPAMEPPGSAAGTVFVDAPQFVVALPRAAGPPRRPGTSLLAHSG